MLTASSCATLAAVRCRFTPITLFTVGSCELETNLGIDGNRTSGSIPPDFTLVLGGMTVLIPSAAAPHDGEHVPPLAERHRTALHARPRSNDHLNSTASTAAAAMNSTCEIFQPGLPGRAKMSSQFAIRSSSGSGVRRQYRTNYSVIKCHLAPADSSVGWMSCGIILQNAAIS